MVAYDRPLEATLYVHLENGETWKAMPEDLAKFNLVDRHEAYMHFDDLFTLALESRRYDSITDAHLNPLRYLVECAIVYPMIHFTQGTYEDQQVLDEVLAIEQALEMKSQGREVKA